MANERVFLNRNTGTADKPVWERWFAKTVFDAVLMSESNGETKNIKQYVDEKIALLIGGAPETGDTLKELFDLITGNKDIVDALNEAIAKKAAIDHSHPDATKTVHGFMSIGDKSKLDGVATGANNYTHPANHPATMITEDVSHRFSTDIEKTAWNGKAGTSTATGTANGLMAAVDKSKLDGVAISANNYTHPGTHAATMITEDASRRFVSDAEKNTWNGKASIYFSETLPSSAPVGALCFLIG